MKLKAWQYALYYVVMTAALLLCMFLIGILAGALYDQFQALGLFQ